MRVDMCGYVPDETGSDRRSLPNNVFIGGDLGILQLAM